MILFDELNVIGEISKFNMISEKGRSYIKVLTNCENSIHFFKEWIEKYSNDKRTITFFDQFKVLSIFNSVTIVKIKNDSFDWYGNFIPLSIEIELDYSNIQESIASEKSEYFQIYKSFIRDKKINQIVD
jgi:tRNA(Ser,Leu) C12 N-acetylase TAN1